MQHVSFSHLRVAQYVSGKTIFSLNIMTLAQKKNVMKLSYETSCNLHSLLRTDKAFILAVEKQFPTQPCHLYADRQYTNGKIM